MRLLMVGGAVSLSLDAHLWLCLPHLQYPTDFLFSCFFVDLIVITNYVCISIVYLYICILCY